MSYIVSVGYLPAAMTIDPTQAHTVALRFTHRSNALKMFTKSRRIEGLDHQLRMLAALWNLFHSVPRGRGYCLDRAAITNLHGYVMHYDINTATTAKEYAHV